VAAVGLVFAALSHPGRRRSGGSQNDGLEGHDVGGTTAGSPAAANATTTTSQGPGPVTISAVGDTDLGNTPDLPPDPSTYLQQWSPPGCTDRVRQPGGHAHERHTSKCAAGSTECYAFRNPPSYAQIYRAAGFTVMNSANNHSTTSGPKAYGHHGRADECGIVQAGSPARSAWSPSQDEGRVRRLRPYANVNNLLDFATAKTLIAKRKPKRTSSLCTCTPVPRVQRPTT